MLFDVGPTWSGYYLMLHGSMNMQRLFPINLHVSRRLLLLECKQQTAEIVHILPNAKQSFQFLTQLYNMTTNSDLANKLKI